MRLPSRNYTTSPWKAGLYVINVDDSAHSRPACWLAVYNPFLLIKWLRTQPFILLRNFSSCKAIYQNCGPFDLNWHCIEICIFSLCMIIAASGPQTVHTGN